MTADAELRVTNAQIFYDKAVEAVRDVSFVVAARQIVTLLGSNGAGKSTMIKAVSGILASEKGALTSGTITYRDRNIARARPDGIVRAGIVQVPEGRRLFIDLTVEENIMMGGYTAPRSERAERLARVYDIFPAIVDHRNRISGYLSGGQQQMVAIGRALMSSPSLLMLDEPTLGLAPKIAEEIFVAIERLSRSAGISVLVVEQNAALALQIADYGYVLDQGRIVFDGSRERLLSSPEIKEFYLGMDSSAGQRSMRTVKHYRRRKRWLS